MISGKRAFLELLRQEGVEIIFGNPGTTELPLMDILAVDAEPRYVLGLQESIVVAMAGGYAQASGKLTVANVHAAPGLGNALGMLYDAQKAGAPLLLTAGQHEQALCTTEPLLYADLPEIARPFVKWATEVRNLADLPRAVHRAAKTALAPPMGPVFLSLPVDVLNAECDLDLGRPTRVALGIRGDQAAIEKAAELMASAKRPVIIAGDPVRKGGAFSEVIELAERLGAPVYFESVSSTASFPSSHPLCRGTLGRLAPTIASLLAPYDLLFAIGGDLFTLSLPSEVDPMPKGMTIVQLDTDPWTLGKNYPAEVAMLGEPKATLPELTAAVQRHMSADAQGRARARLDEEKLAVATQRTNLRARAAAAETKLPIPPLALMRVIADALPAEAVVVEEVLSSIGGLRELLKSDDPQSFFSMRGGGIGWALPAALGVKLATPDRPVVAIIGDGSAMFTFQALWTAAHERVGVVFIIVNNRSYRILKQRVTAMQGYAAQTGNYVAMDLGDPPIDFAGMARSLGVPAERARTLDEVRAFLDRAIRQSGPVLIDVEVDGAL